MGSEVPTVEKALVPDQRSVVVGGHCYIVSQLTLRQLIKLSALAAGLQSEIKNRIAAAADEGKPDFMVLASSLHPEDFAHLLAVLLNADGKEHMDRFLDITVKEVSELAVAVTEVNDIEEMARNFRKAAENAKALLASVTPSPSSSEK